MDVDCQGIHAKRNCRCPRDAGTGADIAAGDGGGSLAAAACFAGSNAFGGHDSAALPAAGSMSREIRDHPERGSGTVLAAGLALVVMMVMALMLLLAQSTTMASRAAAAADLAALAAADALRGLASGEPCAVAAEVAGRHASTLVSCSEGAGQSVEVRTELLARSVLGAASGQARAGPPP